jgi:hypothetical protein
MFKKTNLSVDTTSLTVENCQGQLYKEYGPLKYYLMKNTNDEIKALAEKLQPTGIRWVEIKEGVTLSAHIDHGLASALNIYVQSGNAITNFWTKKPNEEGHAFKNETLKNIYRFDQLDLACSFQAADNEIVLLDVSQIHSVHSVAKTRLFVQFNWVYTSFDEVLDKLRVIDV